MQLGIRWELVGVLSIWYVIFVVGDVGTTVWLIYNSGLGLAGEMNPIGAILFSTLGAGGLLMAKVAIFIPYAILYLYFDAKFRHISWFKEAVEALLLGMVDYSLIIFLNNLLAIIAVGYLAGYGGIVSLLPLFKFLVFVLTLTLSTLLLKLFGYTKTLTLVQGLLGAAILVGPLLAFDQAFAYYLRTNLLILVGYMTGILALLTVGFYVADELLKYRRGEPSRLVDS